MYAIFLRIVSFVMSVVFMIAGYGSWIGGIPVVDVKVFDSSLDGFLGTVDGKYRIFYTYDEWTLFCKSLKDERKKAFASEFKESDFDNRSLAVIDIEKSSSDWKVMVTDANQDGTTLEVNYVKVSQADVVGAQVVCNATIFAFTHNKYVSKVSLNERERMFVPFLIDACEPKYYHIFQTECTEESAEEFGKETVLFKDFESWKAFNESGKWKFIGCEHTFDEDYFERKNLAVTIVSHSAGDSLRICLPVESGNELKFTRYSVNEPIVAPGIMSFDAVFVETSKNIDVVSVEKGEDMRIPFMLDGSVPVN